MKACGGEAKGLQFNRKLVRMTPPGLGLMREEIRGKTIQLKPRLWNHPLCSSCLAEVHAAIDQGLLRNFVRLNKNNTYMEKKKSQ